MPGETRIEKRLDRAVDRATTPRGAAVLIAVTSIVMTLLAGFLMTVLDHESYPSVGLGLWWAVQTVTTVGYGDAVPTTVAGRSLAAAVMLFGISFLTVITAAITSTFVARTRAGSGPTPEQFERMDERLERIEAALRDSSSGSS